MRRIILPARSSDIFTFSLEYFSLDDKVRLFFNLNTLPPRAGFKRIQRKFTVTVFDYKFIHYLHTRVINSNSMLVFSFVNLSLNCNSTILFFFNFKLTHFADIVIHFIYHYSVNIWSLKV